MAQLNLYSDLGTIAQAVQEDAIFVVRETYVMQSLVKNFGDMSGGNARIGYQYNQATAGTIAEADDLTSSAFTPAVDQTLTPREIAVQFFISDLRAASEAPESILADAARELGMAIGDKIQYDLITDMASLTGGTLGGAGSALTWGHAANAIANARQANKSGGVPLKFVMHNYQYLKLASSASIAGATTVAAPGYSEELSRLGYVQKFMNVDIVQVYAGTPAVNGTGGTAWFTGGVFPQNAIALDWRRPIRIEAQRDASRRGVELNCTAVYAHGVWRPALGVQFAGFATLPVA